MIRTPTEKRTNRLLKSLKIINLTGGIILAYWSVMVVFLDVFYSIQFGVQFSLASGVFFHPFLLIVSVCSFIMYKTRRYTLNKVELVVSIIVVTINGALTFYFDQFIDPFYLFIKLIGTIIFSVIIIIYPILKIILVRRLQS